MKQATFSLKKLGFSVAVLLITAVTAFAYNGKNVVVSAATIGSYAMVSVNNTGDGQGGNGASTIAGMSEDGNAVAFTSTASNLVANDTNGIVDLFVRDLKNGVTKRANQSTLGVQSDSSSLSFKAISKTGRYVAYKTNATTLEKGPLTPTTYTNTYIHDMATGKNTWVDYYNYMEVTSVSDDGRFIFATNANLYGVVYTLNTSGGYDLTRLMPTLDGVDQSVGQSHHAASCDGSFVVFMSGATNLTPNDTNGQTDIFLVDLRKSPKITNITQPLNSSSMYPSISCNGQYIAFQSLATNIVASPSVSGGNHEYRYDRINGTFDMVDVSEAGTASYSYGDPGDVTDDGKVFFRARYSEGAPMTTSLRDPDSQATVYLPTGAVLKNYDKHGRKFAISSTSSTLVSSDTNGFSDVFVSELIP